MDKHFRSIQRTSPENIQLQEHYNIWLFPVLLRNFPNGFRKFLWSNDFHYLHFTRYVKVGTIYQYHIKLPAEGAEIT